MKLWVWTFHTATLSYVSDSLLHGKYLFFNQKCYIDSSVFIGIGKEAIFFLQLVVYGRVTV